MIEVERKFLVTKVPDYVKEFSHSNITQWYLSKPTDSTEVRFRVYSDDNGIEIDGKCYLDIKIGKGMIRKEIGQKVDYNKYKKDILGNFPFIFKSRYRVPKDEYTIFVDFYENGLVTAEVEVSEDRIEWLENFVPEDWMCEDITGNIKYKNITLAYENF